VLPYKIRLPLIFGGAGQPLGDWIGEDEYYLFDPATCVEVVSTGYTIWNHRWEQGDQEVYFTFTDVSGSATRQDLLFEAGGLDALGTIIDSSFLIDVRFDATTSDVQVNTLSPGGIWDTHGSFGGIEYLEGDRFGARASIGGLVEIYRNDELIGRVDLSAGAAPWAYIGQGNQIGVWFDAPDFGADGASFTDFGGGLIP